jgi:hypothetical protein
MKLRAVVTTNKIVTEFNLNLDMSNINEQLLDTLRQMGLIPSGVVTVQLWKNNLLIHNYVFYVKQLPKEKVIETLYAHTYSTVTWHKYTKEEMEERE